MPRPAPSLAAVAMMFLLAACASRPLPKYEKPIARAPIQTVRTTAYTHSEADHIKHGRKNALGTTLQASRMRSAAADWSRWPAGTIFRIVETGEIYRVDDYGWALAGTNTIDLYKPSRAAMNAWGVRRVTIQNIVWGDVDQSLSVLRGRSKYKHVRRMLNDLERRYATLKKPMEAPSPLIADTSSPAAPASQSRPDVRRAQPVAQFASAKGQSSRRGSGSSDASRSGAALTPFQATR